MIDQTLVLDATLTDDSWGLARIVRRRAPWNVDRIQLPITTTFESLRDGMGVDIYHVDTGCLTTHEEFGGRATLVYNRPGGDSDTDGHGTMTASLACGETVGVARGALLWAYRSHTGDNQTEEALVDCLERILTHYTGRAGTGRPAVVNLSTFVTGEADVSAAVADLIDAGMVCVSSAGNDGQNLGVDVTYYPPLTADVICVGGFGMADIPQYFARDDGTYSITNYGANVDILAPGQHARAAGIASDSSYHRTSCSTSGAAPYVSGVIACMLEGHARLTSRAEVQAVRDALLANATTGKLRASSYGLTLPDRLLYLDPLQTAPEAIPGL